MSVVLVVGGAGVGDERRVGVEAAQDRGDLAAAPARLLSRHEHAGECTGRACEFVACSHLVGFRQSDIPAQS